MIQRVLAATHHRLHSTLAELDATKQISQSKSEFLATATHEIRGQINAITGFSQMLRDGSLQQDDREECVRILDQSAQQLLSFINDILDVSRIDAGRMVLACEPATPRALLAEVVELYTAKARQKDLALHHTVDPAVPEQVSLDPIRFRQIAINLISNAVKFTEQGSVTVRLASAPAEGYWSWLDLEVQDTGVGIPPERVHQLFQPFGETTSTSHGTAGSGLGLALAQRMARLHGGDLTVQSAVGTGTTFHVRLRVGSVDASADRGNVLSRLVPGSTVEKFAGRVLIAEDMPSNVRLLQMMLRSTGLENSVVGDGSSAVRAVWIAKKDGRPFDIVLMDMRLPTMDGYAATRCLRRQGYTGRIVAVTGDATPDDVQACLDAGCDAHLAKPFSKAQLMDVLAAHMRAAA